MGVGGMTSTTALSFLCIITIALAQQPTPDGCYVEYTNSKVTCMTSFVSQNVASQQECTALCSQNSPKCKAAQLSTDTSYTKSCQLFDTALSVKTTGRRRRLAGCYGYGATVIYSPGSSYYVPTGYGAGCSGHGVSTSGTTMAVQSDPTTPTVATQTVAPTTMTTTLATETGAPTTMTTAVATTASTTVAQTDAPTVPTAAATTTATISSTSSDSQLPPEATCPSGKVVRYTVVDGYQLSGQADFAFQAANEQACTAACTSNRIPDGRQAPCRSADYNAKTQQCSISLQVTPPVGTTAADANPDSKHFEKICVNATTGQNCPGAYFRAPQYVLIGFAQAVASASSTAECLDLCANSQSRFSFVCMSGVYYFAETSNNCILNSETRSGHQELFVPENNDGVEYFEPGCTTSSRVRRQTTGPKKRNRNILRLNSDTFGGWSMCDALIHSHMRFRQCETLNPNRCQIDLNGCEPAKENDYDLDANGTAPQGRLLMRRRNSAVFATPKRAFPPTTRVPQGRTTPKTAISLSTPLVKSRSLKPGDCVPVARKDGRRDCENGVRTLPNGKTRLCKPTKKECDAEKEKVQAKQKGSRRQ